MMVCFSVRKAMAVIFWLNMLVISAEHVIVLLLGPNINLDHPKLNFSCFVVPWSYRDEI